MTIAVPVTEIAFTTKPTETPVWVDVSADVVSWAFTRGRQTELDDMAAGTYAAVLYNDDRRYDPGYASGPYYGNLKRMRRIRQRATWNGATEELMHAYVRSWTPYRDADGRQYCGLVADDALRVLGLAELNTSFVEEQAHQRVGAVLTAANWQTGTPWILDDPTYAVLGTTTILAPLGDRAIDVSQSSLQAVTLTNTPALAHLQDVERSELGLLFASKQGGITFHNRKRRLLAGSQASLATFGDLESNGELPYVSVLIAYDDSQLWNDVRVTRTGGTAQVASDATSQSNHFVRTLRRDVLLLTDSEASAIAGYLVNRYADPPPRITGMTIDPQYAGSLGGSLGTDLWAMLLQAELGDVVTVRNRPWLAAGGGAVVEQKSLIESIHLEWDTEAARWRAAWALSPADTTGYWVLGESLLGTSTTLAI